MEVVFSYPVCRRGFEDLEMLEESNELDELLQMYFTMNLKYQEIIDCLVNHNIIISIRTLKRKLAKLHLGRRKNRSDHNEVINFIRQEIQGSGQMHGYKWMHLKCIQNGFSVTKSDVRIILLDLDPVGVAVRSRRRLRRRTYSVRGPNMLWHIDGYDKLKPYGLAIHGCIDGFSRYVVWLKAGSTNNNPRVIAAYYTETIQQLGGCPRTIRSDHGTENGIVEALQNQIVNIRRPSDKPAFIKGRSPNNQRIEAWWGMLRRQMAQFWMNEFQELKDDGNFDGSELDKNLVRYTFTGILQRELDRTVSVWNTHRIRRTRNAISPSGMPFIMFNNPMTYNTTNGLITVTQQDIDLCITESLFQKYVCDENIYALCSSILEEESRSIPTDFAAGKEVYLLLRARISSV